MCLFNLCQVSQDKNFPKPFPQIQALAGDPNPLEQQKEAEMERILGISRKLNLCIARIRVCIRGPASSPALSPQHPTPVLHTHLRVGEPRASGLASRRDLRRLASALGVGSTLKGGGDRRPVPGWAAGRREPAGRARPGGSALSPSERASGAGGAICNRADATTAPYSRGAGAGGQVTAAHPPPPSRVVPAQEEPPGAL